ncbi:hypothetical protein EVAR_5672_1 [Eumeta japonica]|uniref:Uncharacterized protein n=1 Tax=Eumeta variegata TaxID=151549 RepID=A0A4C1TAM7_EUMVA|nr:hypothetical protein EVAR_5672_1 [Eumeta japonica]
MTTSKTDGLTCGPRLEANGLNMTHVQKRVHIGLIDKRFASDRPRPELSTAGRAPRPAPAHARADPPIILHADPERAEELLKIIHQSARAQDLNMLSSKGTRSSLDHEPFL